MVIFHGYVTVYQRVQTESEALVASQPAKRTERKMRLGPQFDPQMVHLNFNPLETCDFSSGMAEC